MAHLYERYLTNTKEVEVTDRLIEALLLTMRHEGPGVMADPNNYNDSCGVGRSQDWLSHKIEHELSAMYDCTHGAGLAVTIPSVFTYVMNHDVMRFAQVATRVWDARWTIITLKERTENYEEKWKKSTDIRLAHYGNIYYLDCADTNH